MPLVDVKRKRKSLQLEDGKPVIGVIARLVPEKEDLFLDCIDPIAKQRKGRQFLIISDDLATLLEQNAVSWWGKNCKSGFPFRMWLKFCLFSMW